MDRGILTIRTVLLLSDAVATTLSLLPSPFPLSMDVLDGFAPHDQQETVPPITTNTNDDDDGVTP